MRVHYIPTAETHRNYHSVINNDYGYIYNVQSGSGIGGFLKKMLKTIIPIGKSILHHGYELAKPELSKIVNKGAEEISKQAVKTIGGLHMTVQNKLNRKRNSDALS